MAVIHIDSLRQSPGEQKHNTHLEMFPVVSKELTGRCVHFEFVVSENTAKYSLIFFNRLSCILSA